MKLLEFPALDLYVWGAFSESSGVSLKDYCELDLEVPEGSESMAGEANEEVTRVRRVDESYFDLGYTDNADRCRCPIAFEFSELYF